MMADNEYPDAIIVYDAIEHGVGKPMDDAAANLGFNDWKLGRIAGDSFDDSVDFGAEFGVQSGSGAAVMRRCFVDITDSRRVKLEPHSPLPRVRR